MKPTHKAFIVNKYKSKDGEEKSQWTEICPIWVSDNGAMTVRIPQGMSLSGDIVILVQEDKVKEVFTEASGGDLPF